MKIDSWAIAIEDNWCKMLVVVVTSLWVSLAGPRIDSLWIDDTVDAGPWCRMLRRERSQPIRSGRHYMYGCHLTYAVLMSRFRRWLRDGNAAGVSGG